MVVDELRSFHLAPCRMLLGSGEVIWVRWYRARDDALPLPFPSAFASAVWITDYEEDSPPVGMQGPPPSAWGKIPSAYRWRPGAYPAPPGRHWHGKPEWFLTGLPPEELGRGVPDDVCGEPAMFGQVHAQPVAHGDMTGESRVTKLFVDKRTMPVLTSNQNDYPIPDGVAFRLSSTVPVSIGGFTDGEDGRLILARNVGGVLMVLPNEDLGSLAANRVVAIDGVSVKLWPNQEAWLQYDGAVSRWVEMQTLPYISQKGDILTATDSGPSVLRASGNSGFVLTENPAVDEGMDWEPPPVSGDWFGRLSGSIGIPGYEHWQVGGHAVGCLVANVDVPGGVLFGLPIVTPRGGTIVKIAVVVDLPSVVVGAYARLGIYASASADAAAPGALLQDAGSVAIDSSGRGELTLTPAVEVAPGSVIWLALWSSHDWNGRCMSGTVAPSFGPWPVLGFNVPETLCPGCGWAQGDPMTTVPNYPTGLPDPFGNSTPSVAITALTVDDTRNVPAIFILWA